MYLISAIFISFSLFTIVSAECQSDFIEETTELTETMKMVETTDLVETTEPTETTTEVQPKTITYRVTAYCSCAKCCGEYAHNRPSNKGGNPIVYGAAGRELKPNYSCASPLPFGTKVTLDGLGTFVVEDRTAKWVVNKYGENIIDIYFDNHNEAIKFGCRYVEGVVD